MTMPVRRIAVLGNHTPRRCGIATFTDDLAQAIAQDRPDVEVLVAAMNDGPTYPYPARVQLTIEQAVNQRSIGTQGQRPNGTHT